MAIIVARCEIHLLEIAAVAKRGVHQADAFKKRLPVKLGGQPHAGNNVAYCHGHRCLFLMFGTNNLVGGGALGGEALIQPSEDGSDFWIEVAQALNQAHRESALQRRVSKTAKYLVR